jgi:hypothetical protein
MLALQKYSIGVGDRFARQAKAQLQACVEAARSGINVIPVWNKSNREHNIVGSDPASVRVAADAAVRALGWGLPYHVDADHINLETVDRFAAASDFFTLDVASAIGCPPAGGEVEAFVDRHPELVGSIRISGIEQPFQTTPATIAGIAAKYLGAVSEAARIYRRVAELKPDGRYITEVSMDETDEPQTPVQLLVILAAIADEMVPVQTIAPKFTGRFNKGVDYVGDLEQFEREFQDDLAVIRHATRSYRLPANLKLSVHSGSDKFSIYGAMRRTLGRMGAGVHIKTAGTTWLEELIGLAEADGPGLALAKEVYAEAWAHRRELCEPYAAVIDIRESALPDPQAVSAWTSCQYTSALRHDQSNPDFNPDLRQLLHVGYKVAARMGTRYLDMLDACQESISRNVTGNLLERHIRPLFLGD